MTLFRPFQLFSVCSSVLRSQTRFGSTKGSPDLGEIYAHSKVGSNPSRVMMRTKPHCPPNAKFASVQKKKNGKKKAASEMVGFGNTGCWANIGYGMAHAETTDILVIPGTGISEAVTWHAYPHRLRRHPPLCAEPKGKAWRSELKHAQAENKPPPPSIHSCTLSLQQHFRWRLAGSPLTNLECFCCYIATHQRSSQQEHPLHDCIPSV